jgi:hypothetical protein
MDFHWNKVVNETQTAIAAMHPGQMPNGYSTDIKHLVRPIGDLNQPLIILSSYPTMTSANNNYATVNDPSNTCMFRLYAKLGLDRPRAAAGVLHLDDTLLRIDRKVATKAYGPKFYRLPNGRVPATLRKIWDRFSFNLIDQSKSTIGLLVGNTGTKMLMRYFKSRNVKFKTFDEHNVAGMERDSNSRGSRLPIAVKEYETDARGARLKRLWFATFHPEYFTRTKAKDLKNTMLTHMMTFRERLIDMTYVLAYGMAPPRPGYLSCPSHYLTSFQVGLIVPAKVLETLDLTNTSVVKELFGRPDWFLTSNIKRFLATCSSTLLKERADKINHIVSVVRLKPSAARSYWSTEAIKQMYGHNAIVYSMSADQSRAKGNTKTHDFRRATMMMMSEKEPKEWKAKDYAKSKARYHEKKRLAGKQSTR